MGPTSTPNRVHIFDTTLRDGEQSPGISLNTGEKVEIAQQLARLGVDVIEAGFPITSPGDFEAVEAIARRVEGPVICGLARTHKADIDAAWGAIKDAQRPRIHTFISTSDIHIEHQLQTDREDVKGQAQGGRGAGQGLLRGRRVLADGRDPRRRRVHRRGLRDRGRGGRDRRSTSPTRSATRRPRSTPSTSGASTSWSRACARSRPRSTATTTWGWPSPTPTPGVLAGARQVECAVNGIGERAGNCSLEEIVMLIRTREDVHGLTTGLNTRELARTSRMVSRLTGYAIQPNKAVVGRNAFAHESGIHQDGVLKERTTYEIMDATEVGLESNSIVLGKHSGRHALNDALEQLGFKVEGNALNAAFKRFKEVADRKKQVTALDLEAIVSDEMREKEDAHELAWFEVEAGLAARAAGQGRGEDALRRGGGRRVERRRPGRRDLPRDPEGGRHRVRAAPVHGRGGDRGRGRPRPGDRDAARRRTPGHRPGRRHRHPRGLGPRLRAGAVQRPRGRRDPRGRGGDRRGRRRTHPGPLAPDPNRIKFAMHYLANLMRFLVCT